MIEVEKLTYTYRGNSEPTLHELDFTIDSGEIFGFLGPSGSGKSTTQKVLTGLLPSYGGSVRVGGKSLAEYGTEYYESVGVGFELPNHFEKLTAMENLKLFAALYRGDTRDPAELMDLVGLGDVQGQRVSTFSKGMKMRLNFVRALLPDPDLLFLDEPTAGLDPGNARHVKDLVLDLKRRGRTIFLTTHNMSDADELCDRVAFIVDGAIRRIGTPRELRVGAGRRQVVVEHRLVLPDGSDGLVERSFDLDNLGANEEFLALIRDHEIETLHSQEATLEDVFIETTGRRLA
jgi:fluoroquinolone transport system ATP-binding protein